MLDESLRIPLLDLRILTCRYRQLTTWGRTDLSAPFWRLYWNPTLGAWIHHEGERIDLGPTRRILIAPHTTFAGGLDAPFDHFFIHFTIGDAYAIDGGVFLDEMTAGERRQLTGWTKHLTRSTACSTPMALTIHTVLLRWLRGLPADSWRPPIQDPRIRTAISLLQANLADPPANERLASYVDLHPGSFVRLFTAQVGIPPHRYTLLARLDHACNDLLHSDLPVETIARMWGFADRQHFTRTLKKHRYVTPGQLRRQSR